MGWRLLLLYGVGVNRRCMVCRHGCSVLGWDCFISPSVVILVLGGPVLGWVEVDGGDRWWGLDCGLCSGWGCTLSCGPGGLRWAVCGGGWMVDALHCGG